MSPIELNLAALRDAALRDDEDAAAEAARRLTRALRPQRVSLPPMPRALIEEALAC
mgnify:CR=1 FL=1|jgi:hypothetical protein